jgi:hypothetical protein
LGWGSCRSSYSCPAWAVFHATPAPGVAYHVAHASQAYCFSSSRQGCTSMQRRL